MKVFIFGAGASKDSQGSKVPVKNIAPLSDELFHEKYCEIALRVGLSKPVMNRCRNEMITKRNH